AKDYLHRGGRTARAGESGSVVTLVLPEQRRDVSRLMATAGIRPESVQVRPGDAALARVTGAREPSGVPVTIVAPPVPASRTRTSGGSASDGGARPAHRASGRSRRPRRPRTV
ncbi:RNA helicase, partial [Micromonospora sp. M51]|nr:RNA helicase [Micromonospora sp. M51]